MLPRALVYAADVTAPAKICWSVLQDAMRAGAAWTGTTSQLATLVGLDERQARRLTRQLEAAGWLVITAAGRAGNRYELLGRARVVDDLCTTAERGRTSMSPQPRSWADINVRGHGVPTSYPCAREEKSGQIAFDLSTGAGGGGAPRRPPHCGRCDERTRLLDWIDPADGAAPRRCPDCHPLVVAPF